MAYRIGKWRFPDAERKMLAAERMRLIRMQLQQPLSPDWENVAGYVTDKDKEKADKTEPGEPQKIFMEYDSSIREVFVTDTKLNSLLQAFRDNFARKLKMKGSFKDDDVVFSIKKETPHGNIWIDLNDSDFGCLGLSPMLRVQLDECSSTSTESNAVPQGAPLTPEDDHDPESPAQIIDNEETICPELMKRWKKRRSREDPHIDRSYVIPTLPLHIEEAIEVGRELFPAERSELVRHISTDMCRIVTDYYPNQEEFRNVVMALLTKYPVLCDGPHTPGSSITPEDGTSWKLQINTRFKTIRKEMRSKQRRTGVKPEDGTLLMRTKAKFTHTRKRVGATAPRSDQPLKWAHSVLMSRKQIRAEARSQFGDNSLKPMEEILTPKRLKALVRSLEKREDTTVKLLLESAAVGASAHCGSRELWQVLACLPTICREPYKQNSWLTTDHKLPGGIPHVLVKRTMKDATGWGDGAVFLPIVEGARACADDNLTLPECFEVLVDVCQLANIDYPEKLTVTWKVLQDVIMQFTQENLVTPKRGPKFLIARTAILRAGGVFKD